MFAYTILFVQALTVGVVKNEPFLGVMVPQIFGYSATTHDGMEFGDVVLGVDSRLFNVNEVEVVSQFCIYFLLDMLEIKTRYILTNKKC